MSVTIKTDVAKWRRAIESAASKATNALAEQMMNDSLDYIPKAEGILRDAGRIEQGDDCAYLVWNNVYAAYQWYGVRADGTHEVKHYTTAGTGTAWVDQAESANREKWQQVAQNAFTEGLD